MAACAALILAGAVALHWYVRHKVDTAESSPVVWAIVSVPALPWVLVLAALLWRRRAASFLMTMSISIPLGLYGAIGLISKPLLLYDASTIPTFAVLFGTSAMALTSSIVGWRRLPRTERPTRLRTGLFLALPWVAAGAAIGVSWWLKATDDTWEVRQAKFHHLDQQFGELASCVARESAAHAAAPENLRSLPDDCARFAQSIETETNYRLSYWHAPADSPLPRRFVLCMQPHEAPDDGITTFVGDDTGVVGKDTPHEHTDTPLPCSDAAWLPIRLVKRFEFCLLRYWEKSNSHEFPDTLDAIRKTVPGCLDDKPPGKADLAREVVPTEGQEHVFASALRYERKPAMSGRSPGYWLLVRCPKRMDSFGVIDETRTLLNANLQQGQVWLNTCRQREGTDVIRLARGLGLLLPASTTQDQPNWQSQACLLGNDGDCP